MTGREPRAVAGGREQWLRAGQELLRAGGIVAVKLHALSARAGLTTGSFYHHFAGMTEFLEELARFYGDEQIAQARAKLDGLTPLERLRLLAESGENNEMLPLHAAMRDWAGSNPIAADSVRAADDALLSFVEEAFVELGHSPVEARTRAVLLFSLGVARIHPPWPAPRETVENALAILVPKGE